MQRLKEKLADLREMVESSYNCIKKTIQNNSKFVFGTFTVRLLVIPHLSVVVMAVECMLFAWEHICPLAAGFPLVGEARMSLALTPVTGLLIGLHPGDQALTTGAES